MAYRIKPFNEGFFNPYDEETKKEEKKNVRISDGGGSVIPRKEIFNINRVEYSKRPNGEFVVYSKTQFAKGEIVEICPIIIVGMEAKAIPNLKNYIFEIEKSKNKFGVVLGYGSLYKHSENPNLNYAYNRSNRQMYFTAARPIQAQEELSINYGKDFWDEQATFNTVAAESKPTVVNLPKTNESSGMVKNKLDATGEKFSDDKFVTVAKSSGKVNIAPLGSGQS